MPAPKKRARRPAKARRARTPTTKKSSAKRRITLRSKQPSNRGWKILIGFAIACIFVWLGIWFSASVLSRVFGFVDTTQTIAIQSATDPTSLLVVHLSPEDDRSKVYVIRDLPQINALQTAWDLTTVTRVLTQRVVRFDQANFDTVGHVRQAVKDDAIKQLLVRDWESLRTDFSIWRTVFEHPVQEISFDDDTPIRVAALTYVGQNCPVGVANTTSVAGAAGAFADLLSQQGAIVVRVTNQQQPVEASVILVDSDLRDACSQVASLIKTAMPEQPRIEYADNIFSEHRVGVLVLLNEDLAERMQELTGLN